MQLIEMILRERVWARACMHVGWVGGTIAAQSPARSIEGSAEGLHQRPYTACSPCSTIHKFRSNGDEETALLLESVIYPVRAGRGGIGCIGCLATATG